MSGQTTDRTFEKSNWSFVNFLVYGRYLYPEAPLENANQAVLG